MGDLVTLLFLESGVSLEENKFLELFEFGFLARHVVLHW